MSNIILKNVAKIQYDKISILEYKEYISIKYTDTITLIGIPFKCRVEISTIKNKYFIQILDPEIIKFLKEIDRIFTDMVPMYHNILYNHMEHIGIIMNINPITSRIINDKPKALCMNIKYINKGFYNKPIIHIIDT